MQDAHRDIQTLLTRHLTAIRDKDAAALIATLSDDVMAFDLAPPLAHGPDATRDPASHQAWFDTWTGPIEIAWSGLSIEASDDAGWARGLNHMTGVKTDGGAVDLWYRTTACLRRTGEGWRIAHLHSSVPFAMDGSGRALLDLRPVPAEMFAPPKAAVPGAAARS